MKALTDALTRFEPPQWMVFAVAALAAVALLSAFVDTLQAHVRHGEEFREHQRGVQRVSSVRQPISTVADASLQGQQPQLR